MDNLNNLYIPVRERIFTLLKSNSIQQKDFAKAIGVNAVTVTDWKKGKSTSFMKKISDIAEALGTSEVWLLTGKGTLQNPETVKELETISDSSGIYPFDLVGIGKSLDRYQIEIETIPKEGGKDSREVMTTNARQLFDRLDLEAKKQLLGIVEADALCRNIERCCERRGVTLEAACKACGVGETFFREISKGEAPSIIKFKVLAEYLGVTTSELLGEEKSAQEGGRGNRVSYSPEARRLAEDYDKKLDAWGRKAVRAIADSEVARCEDEAHFLADAAKPEEPKIIPLYRNPAAAGYASPVFGQDYDPYALKPEDPQGAVFAVRLQGDSMEPDFPDGGIVFCNRDPLADGDIGVFNVDGASVCKQYHKEGPMIFLFSLNRKRADADVMLLPGGNRTLVCQGRVITKKRYRVPGR